LTTSFGKSEKALTRRTIHKKIFGAKKTMGLIPAEYVIWRSENKKRFGKNETTFHLTFKGLFGALASGVSLNRIYIYKIFLKSIDHYVKDKKINEIIKKYFELQIQSFLLWHYIYGIQLKKITTFQSYYMELMDREFSHTDYFKMRINPDIIKASKMTEKIQDSLDDDMYLRKWEQEKNKNYINEIIDVFSTYFTYKGIISLLRKNRQIPTCDEFLNPKFNESNTRDDFIFDKLINDWPIYVESVYQAKTMDDALFDDYFEIATQPNIVCLPQGFDNSTDEGQKQIKEFKEKSNRIYLDGIVDKIRRILKEKEIQVEIPENRAVNVYPF